MKRIKYIIIMAAVLVTAVCFMITFSRKNQAGKPDQVSEASFVFADKAESEGDYMLYCAAGYVGRCIIRYLPHR